METSKENFYNDLGAKRVNIIQLCYTMLNELRKRTLHLVTPSFNVVERVTIC